LAILVSSCELKLTDDAVRVAVSLHLGCSVCVPHTYRRGALVDAHGLHCSTCKQAPTNALRHNATNDVIARALFLAGFPACTKEPTGLIKRVDGKRPTD